MLAGYIYKLASICFDKWFYCLILKNTLEYEIEYLFKLIIDAGLYRS